MEVLIARPCKASGNDARSVLAPRFAVTIMGLDCWQGESPDVELELCRLGKDGPEVLASIKGKGAEARSKHPGADDEQVAKVYTLSGASASSTRQAAKSDPVLKLVFPLKSGSPGEVEVKLPYGDAGEIVARRWDLFLRRKGGRAASPVFSVCLPAPALPARRLGEASRSTYGWEGGNSVEFYNDASVDRFGSGGYFFDLHNAINEARHFVFIVDWSFQPYMRLLRPGISFQERQRLAALGVEADVNMSIGAMLVLKAHAALQAKARGGPDLLIAVHSWDHTEFGAPDLENKCAGRLLDWLTFKLLQPKPKWGGERLRPENLLWQVSSRTGEGGGSGFGWSHHQKYVLLDAPSGTADPRRVLKVFYGGLDLTKGRFDWPDHRVMPGDPDSNVFLDRIKAPDPKKLEALFISSTLGAGPGGVLPVVLPQATQENLGFTLAEFDDWYNAEKGRTRDEPRQPWHDIHARLEGPAAWDFLREFVGRWLAKGSSFPPRGDTSDKYKQVVKEKFHSLFDRSRFVQQWEHRAGEACAQVLRSQCKIHWADEATHALPGGKPLRAQHTGRVELEWPLKGGDRDSFERSIQDAYLRAIDLARNHVYIETQYLIGSGKHWSEESWINKATPSPQRMRVVNEVPERLVEAVKRNHAAKRDFHVHVIMPLFPEGLPNDRGYTHTRYLEWRTMRYMMKAIQDATGNWKRYLSFFFLANRGAADPGATGSGRGALMRRSGRYPIYVHSKLIVVDGEVVILGSANLNERSLNGGRDSEICVCTFPDPAGDAAKARERVASLLGRLWREHLGLDFDPAFVAAPAAPASVAKIQGFAAQNYTAFMAAGPTSMRGHLCAWPLPDDGSGTLAKADEYIADADFSGQNENWRTDGAWKTEMAALDLTE